MVITIGLVGNGEGGTKRTVDETHAHDTRRATGDDVVEEGAPFTVPSEAIGRGGVLREGIISRSCEATDTSGTGDSNEGICNTIKKSRGDLSSNTVGSGLDGKGGQTFDGIERSEVDQQEGSN